jgi:hypothetical protein
MPSRPLPKNRSDLPEPDGAVVVGAVVVDAAVVAGAAVVVGTVVVDAPPLDDTRVAMSAATSLELRLRPYHRTSSIRPLK